MIKLIFLVFVCIKIATGNYNEISGHSSLPSIENSERQQWPVPVYYEELQLHRSKPCIHRRNIVQAGEQWVTPTTPTVSEPLSNSIPQALKNENVEKTADELKANESTPIVELSRNNEINSVTAVTDPFEDSYILDKLNSRSNLEESLNEDYDCDIDLDTKDYLDSQYGPEQFFSKVASTSKTTDNVEFKVIEMLKDCINKKQKYIDGTLTAGNRRSMGDFDHDNDQQAATDKSSDSLKLYNELQNPAKTTGISDITVSRSIPTNQHNSRVCYACSTATNPACWEPNNKTTIKYCLPNQNCITKSFGEKKSKTIIRDCATSCDASSVPGIEPKYKSCSVCHKDYCNSAVTNSYNLAIIFLITAVKCTF